MSVPNDIPQELIEQLAQEFKTPEATCVCEPKPPPYHI